MEKDKGKKKKREIERERGRGRGRGRGNQGNLGPKLYSQSLIIIIIRGFLKRERFWLGYIRCNCSSFYLFIFFLV